MRIDEVPVPVPAKGEVLVRVTYCGICGTDLHEFVDGPNLVATEPNPLTGRSAPITLGHEIVGVVVEANPGKPGLRTGDRVVVEPCLRCGRCMACRSGDPHHCGRLAGIGLAADGGFAPYVAVPAYAVERVPDGVADDDAALTEPLAVALRAATRGGVAEGSRVVVNGFGPIGAAVALWARHLGAAHVLVLEVAPERRAIAETFDVDEVLDGAGSQLAALRSAAHRPTVVVDCTGIGELLPDALRAVAPGGTVVWTGVGPSACTLVPSLLTVGERTLVGSLGHAPFKRVLSALAARDVGAGKMRTEAVALGAAPQAFNDLTENPSALKVLVEP